MGRERQGRDRRHVTVTAKQAAECGQWRTFVRHLEQFHSPIKGTGTDLVNIHLCTWSQGDAVEGDAVDQLDTHT